MTEELKEKPAKPSSAWSTEEKKLISTYGSQLIYEDATQVASATNSGTKSANYKIQMGRYAATSVYLNAKIGPVQIYHKALSVQDLKQNYQAQKERFGF